MTQAGATQAEINEQAQARWGEAVGNGTFNEVFDEVLAEDIVDHDPAPDQGPGREGFKQFFTVMRSAFPDLTPEVEKIYATDEYVTMAYTISGTHEGEFQGVAPTGKRFKIRGMQIARFENGVAVERWGSSDELGLMQQLGIVTVG